MLTHTTPMLPQAASAIQKDVPLKEILSATSIGYLARNIELVFPNFDKDSFCTQATVGLDELTLMQRADHIATALRAHLPTSYQDALDILVASFTPELTQSSDNGLAVFFYLPHSAFIAKYGVKPSSGETDPFDLSMAAQYQLTKRFTAEFSIRSFLLHDPNRALATIQTWLTDPDEHVRRLCSEGTRPRLPWGKRLPDFGKNPDKVLFILEALKDDPSLYVRRSVANHLGDIAKDQPDWVLEICRVWGKDANKERRWLIRHAIRYLDKKNSPGANELRRSLK